jgi:hypothetical protein
VGDVAAHWPSSKWHRLAVHHGEKGPIAYDWACARVIESRGRLPAEEVWLLVRRSVSNPSELAYYLSNGDETTSLATLVHVASSRYTIEQCFEEAKDDVGLDHYEVRTWSSWHRYITLAMMALAWLASVRAKLPDEGCFSYAPTINPALAEQVKPPASGEKSPAPPMRALARRRWLPGAFPKSAA